MKKQELTRDAGHTLLKRAGLIIVLIGVLANTSQAQVPVHEEPRHHPVFQNEFVRLLNVLLPPGDTTQYHLHHTPSVFLFFTTTLTGSQLQEAGPATGRSVAGNFLFENLAAPHQRIHRVWNLDADTFHVMDIELLRPDSGFTTKPLSQPFLQRVIDTPWARVYRVALAPQAVFLLPRSTHPFVLVAMNAAAAAWQKNGKKETAPLQPGRFFWLPSNRAFRLQNKGSQQLLFALIELPGSDAHLREKLPGLVSRPADRSSNEGNN